MRIRTIKPEFWRSDDVSALDVFDRLLFIGLWSYVDDNGVGRDDAVAIAADLFADDLSRKPQETLTHIAGGLQAIEGRGCIVRWTVEDPDDRYYGKSLLKIVHWERHQSIKRPSQGHKYPNPPANVVRHSPTLQETPVRHSPTLQETPGHGTGEQGNRGTVAPSLRSGGLQGGDVHDDTTAGCGSGSHVVADAPTQTTKAKRGTRLPEGWTPERSQANLRAEHDSGLTPDELSSQLDRFRDHWAAQPGSKGTKLDWQATWRNWVRRSAEIAPRTRQSETDAWYARAKARASRPNPLLSLLADDASPSNDPGMHAMPPRSA
nr:MAG TPA: replisome organizer [Caudoviricetes sp.]